MASACSDSCPLRLRTQRARGGVRAPTLFGPNLYCAPAETLMHYAWYACVWPYWSCSLAHGHVRECTNNTSWMGVWLVEVTVAQPPWLSAEHAGAPYVRHGSMHGTWWVVRYPSASFFVAVRKHVSMSGLAVLACIPTLRELAAQPLHPAS